MQSKQVSNAFIQTADGGKDLEATVRFTTVWGKKSGNWQLIRVVSYDHH